jgi:predicted lipoprotein with Yx(FWY)xxD motif
MKINNMLAVLFALALVLAACAPPATEVATMTAEPAMASTEPATTEPSTTETAAASPEPEATNTGAAEIPVTGEPTIHVSESTEFSPILVDDQGLSLYVFTNDTQNGESSNCNDDCAVDWPPFLTQGSPVAGDGVDSTLLGTVTREDGSLQVTYNGWPLYYFHGDTTFGDTNGQGMEGVWFLVTPAGEAVQQ